MKIFINEYPSQKLYDVYLYDKGSAVDAKWKVESIEDTDQIIAKWYRVHELDAHTSIINDIYDEDGMNVERTKMFTIYDILEI